MACRLKIRSLSRSQGMLVLFWTCFGGAPLQAATPVVARGSCVSLKAVLDFAASQSEAIQIQAAAVSKAEAALSAARSAVLPSLGLTGSAVVQDASDLSLAAGGKPSTTQTSSRLTLSQPLFKGGREYAALRAAKAGVEAQATSLEATQIKVARGITARYFAALAAQAEVAALQELRDLSSRRDSQIKSRVAIGKSRPTDGLGSEVQLSSAKAQLDVATLQLETARHQLVSDAGIPLEERPVLMKSGVCDVTLGNVPLANWSDIEARILSRPDLEAERIAVKIAGESVAIARAGHLPSVDLAANYHLKRADARFDGSDWDVTLSATLPLFSGGGVSAAVREAKAVEMQQALRLKLAERQALDEGRDLWERYNTGRRQVDLLQEAASKSESYYRRVAQDERLGLASSLETLQALNSSIDARRAAVKARVQLAQTWRELLLVIREPAAGID
ncbi:MAG: hypothetical protein RIQ81_1479 [Pseudomonadota bacterium]|jgi:outer membrane protein